MNLREYIKEDILRYYSEEAKRNGVSIFKMICTVIRHEELWAIVSYRIGRWIVLTIKNKWCRKGIVSFWSIPNWFIRILSGNIVIYLGADIGKGLYLHYGPIYIGPTKIGEYCNFAMMNVIGFGGRNENYGIPEIGDRVFMGPGAIATGKIKIGNDVAIGANAVVNKSLPDGCMAGGIPARIINDSGSDLLIDIRW